MIHIHQGGLLLITAIVWKDFEFYNFTGFHIYFNDDAMEEICHMQAWTLGLGETVSLSLKLSVSFSKLFLNLQARFRKYPNQRNQLHLTSL